MNRPILFSAVLGLIAAPSLVQGQKPGTMDVGGFVRFTRFDPSLVFTDGWGGGGRLGVFLMRNVAFEATLAYASATTPLGVSVHQFPIHGRLLFAAPVAARSAVLLGAGYVHNAYRQPVHQWEDGASGLLGARLELSPQIDARVDLVADYLPSPLNHSAVVTDNWNFTIQAGIGMRLGGGSGPRDSDKDGVLDAMDACARTPRGEPVDARGCSLPKDADGDGVVDATDRCPRTVAGERVDANGCALPKDADGDGVADVTDRCPGTAAGVKVDSFGCPVDSDGDGVVDSADRCTDTPSGKMVDANGCPLPEDADRDGVLDPADRCPGTPAGQRVNASGCAVLFVGLQRTLLLQGVDFEIGSATLTESAHATLDRVAASLIGSPNVRVEVGGYTDNRGSAAANLRLSQARADAVRAYLIGKGVPPVQLTSRGFGAAGPIASNATAAGRARNRRVELHRMR